jgi:hypothetical protein
MKIEQAPDENNTKGPLVACKNEGESLGANWHIHRRGFLAALSSTIIPRGLRAARFDTLSFSRPPIDCYPGMFWNWNDRMDPQRIRKQLLDQQTHKCFTVAIVPLPRDFRPLTFGNHLDTEYLSDEYFSRYRLAMDEAKRLGMKAWLYDEGGWPSGSATGRVVKSDPSLAAQTLVAERRPLAPDEKPLTPPGAIASFVENGNVLVVCRIHRSTAEANYLHVASDHLNPAATQRFIELTYEGYRRSIPDYLGSLIPWAFSDEATAPSFVPGKQMPWTDALPQIFRQKKGYDLVEALPLLLASPPGQTAEAKRARIDFYDVWSALFQETYLLPIRDWCRAHGLLYGGHHSGEDETMGSALHGYGQILRAMRGMDLPGVDTIWRQLFPGQRNHHFPRYAGSVARQNGHNAVTESFGVYGNGLTLAEMKWLVNFQYVRGCNRLVIESYPAGTSGNLMSGERPHFGPMNPLWQYQPIFQDYTARLGYMLSLGTGGGDVALYFPVRDFWAAAPAKTSPEAQANDDVVLELEKHHVDFDFVDDDLLTPDAVVNGALHAGKMSYRTVVVSLARMMPSQTARTLAQFVRTGGTLVAVTSLPETGPAEPRTFLQALETAPLHLGEERRVGKGRVVLVPKDELAQRVPSTLVLEPTADSLRVAARRLPSGMVYVITNEANAWVETSARIPARMRAKICDLETGNITKAPQSLRLAPWGTVCLLIDPQPAGDVAIEPDLTRSLPVTGDWQIRRVVHTVIENDDYTRKTFSSDPWRRAVLGNWSELVGSDFSGTAEYRVSFVYDGPAGQEQFLELGKVATAGEVWLNGERLGARVWQPYWFRTGKALRKGQNELRIQVTNTLANYLVSPAVRASWDAMKMTAWPGVYEPRQIEFERKSTESGLFGPVRLLAAAG